MDAKDIVYGRDLNKFTVYNNINNYGNFEFDRASKIQDKFDKLQQFCEGSFTEIAKAIHELIKQDQCRKDDNISTQRRVGEIIEQLNNSNDARLEEIYGFLNKDVLGEIKPDIKTLKEGFKTLETRTLELQASGKEYSKSIRKLDRDLTSLQNTSKKENPGQVQELVLETIQQSCVNEFAEICQRMINESGSQTTNIHPQITDLQNYCKQTRENIDQTGNNVTKLAEQYYLDCKSSNTDLQKKITKLETKIEEQQVELQRLTYLKVSGNKDSDSNRLAFQYQKDSQEGQSKLQSTIDVVLQRMEQLKLDNHSLKATNEQLRDQMAQIKEQVDKPNLPKIVLRNTPPQQKDGQQSSLSFQGMESQHSQDTYTNQTTYQPFIPYRKPSSLSSNKGYQPYVNLGQNKSQPIQKLPYMPGSNFSKDPPRASYWASTSSSRVGSTRDVTSTQRDVVQQWINQPEEATTKAYHNIEGNEVEIPPPENRYHDFKFYEKYDGNKMLHDIWIGKFLASCNQCRLTQAQVLEQARALMKEGTEAHWWFEENRIKDNFQTVDDFVTKFYEEFQPDKQKMFNKFHFTNFEPKETPENYLNRLRTYAIPAGIPQDLVKEKLVKAVLQLDRYKHIDPFSVHQITQNPDYTPQKVLETLREYEEAQKYNQLVQHGTKRTPYTPHDRTSGGPTRDKPDKDKKPFTRAFSPRRGSRPPTPKGKGKNGKSNILTFEPLEDGGGILRPYEPEDEEDKSQEGEIAREEQGQDTEGEYTYPPIDWRDSAEPSVQNTNHDPIVHSINTMYPSQEVDINDYYSLYEPTTEYYGYEIQPSYDFEEVQTYSDRQAKLEQELLGLDLAFVKAHQNYAHKKDEYQKKYHKPFDPTMFKPRQQGYQNNNPQGQRRFENEQRAPIYRFTDNVLVTSPFHFISMFRRVVSLLDNPQNMLRTTQTLAQANKLLESLETQHKLKRQNDVPDKDKRPQPLASAQALTKTGLEAHSNQLRSTRRYGSINSNLLLNSHDFEMVKAQDSVSLLYMKINLFGKEVVAMVDTGATISAISEDIIKKFGWQSKLSKCYHELTVADNRSVVVDTMIEKAPIFIENQLAVNTKLLTSKATNWELLMGRNVMVAIKGQIIDNWFHYTIPRTEEKRMVPLYQHTWVKVYGTTEGSKHRDYISGL